MNSKRLLVFVLAFDVLAVLILYPHLDVFSCSYLLLSTYLAFIQAGLYHRFSSS